MVYIFPITLITLRGAANMEKKKWIKFDRDCFSNKDWHNNSKVIHLFLHLLMWASTGDDQWRGIPLKRGQLVTSRRRLSVETGISEETVRSCLSKLLESNDISISAFVSHTVITICDYEKYAGSEDKK